ncbi:hypothetical protein [Actinophytocola glycyrrhizae]|uniref:Uncharacterized protein n=1 Tax=Actinophytocola glycyrrhizae TaxID=2044873 RepID=A0ABV9RZC0_9PSEU
MSYPPQGHGPQGYQPYGPPPPGYAPYGYGPPSPALGYLTAIAFIVCGALALMLAIAGWDGSADNASMIAGLVGVAFTEDLTGNVDFAISATMSVACSSILFGLVMFARLEFVRWILAVIGALMTVYYLYAIIWILSNDGGEFIAMALVSWVLWLAATVVAVLPATGRAMRGRGPSRYPQQYPPQHGYPQQY